MTVLGITGPTGAGKTTLLREVEKLGGTVIDCDRIYHGMLESDSALQERLERAFGPLRDQSGRVDRKRLGAIVFGDPERLAELNGIAWQLVTDRVRSMLEDSRRQGAALAAVDAIALLESPLGALCQTTVAVLAPPEVRVRRVMAREGISEHYARARVEAQRPDWYFSQNCDHTLINNFPTEGEFAQTARQFLQEVLPK